MSEYVRDEPLTALTIAGVTGFVLGGGVNRRLGLAMLTVVGRIALRAVATSLIVGIVTGDNDGARRGSSRKGDRLQGTGYSRRLIASRPARGCPGVSPLFVPHPWLEG